jgi:hypothetical protein
MDRNIEVLFRGAVVKHLQLQDTGFERSSISNATGNEGFRHYVEVRTWYAQGFAVEKQGYFFIVRISILRTKEFVDACASALTVPISCVHMPLPKALAFILHAAIQLPFRARSNFHFVRNHHPHIRMSPLFAQQLCGQQFGKMRFFHSSSSLLQSASVAHDNLQPGYKKTLWLPLQQHSQMPLLCAAAYGDSRPVVECQVAVPFLMHRSQPAQQHSHVTKMMPCYFALMSFLQTYKRKRHFMCMSTHHAQGISWVSFHAREKILGKKPPFHVPPRSVL